MHRGTSEGSVGTPLVGLGISQYGRRTPCGSAARAAARDSQSSGVAIDMCMPACRYAGFAVYDDVRMEQPD